MPTLPRSQAILPQVPFRGSQFSHNDTQAHLQLHSCLIASGQREDLASFNPILYPRPCPSGCFILAYFVLTILTNQSSSFLQCSAGMPPPLGSLPCPCSPLALEVSSAPSPAFSLRTAGHPLGICTGQVPSSGRVGPKYSRLFPHSTQPRNSTEQGPT